MDPPALRNRPVLAVHENYYRQVFRDLSESRGYGQSGSPLPIPISEIHAYCEMFGIWEMNEREALLGMLQAMDRTYRKVVNDQIKAEMDKKT